MWTILVFWSVLPWSPLPGQTIYSSVGSYDTLTSCQSAMAQVVTAKPMYGTTYVSAKCVPAK